MAAVKYAMKPENKGKNIVTILPSNAERYISTVLFEDYMNEIKSLEMYLTQA